MTSLSIRCPNPACDTSPGRPCTIYFGMPMVCVARADAVAARQASGGPAEDPWPPRQDDEWREGNATWRFTGQSQPASYAPNGTAYEAEKLVPGGRAFGWWVERDVTDGAIAFIRRPTPSPKGEP